MSLFICDICGCIDNTATGRYWTKDSIHLWADENLGKALCSECEPTTYRSGELNSDGGKWHGRFEKKKPTEDQIKAGLFINRDVNGNCVENWG
jgi:hypothetical protein